MPVTLLVLAVVFLDPRITIVPNQAQLTKTCNSAAHLYACTAFTHSFSCSCELAKAGWRLRPIVQVTPLMYLWNTTYFAHEHSHIEDLRGSMLEYVGELESRAYATLEECSGDADREKQSFTGTIDVFKEDSNVKRHPFYKRRLSHITVH